MYKLYQVKYYYLIVAKISQKHITANGIPIKKVKTESYTKTLSPIGVFSRVCLDFVVVYLSKCIIFAKNKSDIQS